MPDELTAFARYGDGRLPSGHEALAARLLRAEGVPIRDGRVDLTNARWASAPNVT